MPLTTKKASVRDGFWLMPSRDSVAMAFAAQIPASRHRMDPCEAEQELVPVTQLCSPHWMERIECRPILECAFAELVAGLVVEVCENMKPTHRIDAEDDLVLMLQELLASGEITNAAVSVENADGTEQHVLLGLSTKEQQEGTVAKLRRMLGAGT
ncbi:MAG: hypothetical protein ABWZ88_18655 [Variovorax sp.]